MRAVKEGGCLGPLARARANVTFYRSLQLAMPGEGPQTHAEFGVQAIREIKY